MGSLIVRLPLRRTDEDSFVSQSLLDRRMNESDEDGRFGWDE